jgi:hypothetical protein
MLDLVQSAASKTTTVSTARLSATIKSASGPLAKGLNYDGAFDFAMHRGRFQFDPSALGIPQAAGSVDALFDFSNGLIVYVKIPQIGEIVPGKSWIKFDAGALAAKATGTDLSSIFAGQGSDPTSGLRLLAGAKQVTKAGSEVVRGTPTTHFHVIVDVNRAADAAQPQARDAMRKLADLYVNKTFPIDVWLDGQSRLRRLEQVVDPANLKLPGQLHPAPATSGPITIHVELFDFGSAVDTALPPADQIADSSQLQNGASPPAPPAASGPTSPAKVSYLARGNAICKDMNDKTAALPNPGTDPQQLATVTAEGVAITSAALRQLRALPVPPGDAVTLHAAFAKVDAVVADGIRLVAALRAGDQASAQAVEAKLQADTTTANDAANAYGLTACGS